MILTNITRDQAQYDITHLVSSVSWGGDVREAARQLDIKLISGRADIEPKYIPPLGSIILLQDDGLELMRGLCWTVDREANGNVDISCYDHAIYLTNNVSTYKFINLSPVSMITQICTAFGIPIGDIAPMGIVLPKLILRDLTLYDMILTILTETTKRTGIKYQMVMSQGALTVQAKGAKVSRWQITEGQNLVDASKSESLQGMRNRVVIVGDQDQVLADISDSGLIQQYGMLQEYQRESNINAGEAKVIAQNLLKQLAVVSQDLSISALGINDVVAGTSIEVIETLTGIKGTYYVTADKHTYTNGNHDMDLTLSLDTIVATKEAESDQ